MKWQPSPKRRAKRSAALLFAYPITFVIHGQVLFQALRAVVAGASPSASAAGGINIMHGLMLLAAFEALMVSLLLYLGLCNATRRLSRRQQHDWNLVLWGLMMPTANVAWHFTLPHLIQYEVTKRVWVDFFATQMASAVGFCRLPPAHLAFLAVAMVPPIL